MKKWWLLLSLGVCLPAFADNQNKSCEFLVEGGNPITDTHLGFADGVGASLVGVITVCHGQKGCEYRDKNLNKIKHPNGCYIDDLIW